MKVIGILNWYDEDPAWLAATAASMCSVGMSHIVAMDGAYSLYPGSHRHPRSNPGQAAAIREVCNALGVGCTVHSPTEPFAGNEPEKRSLGFRMAEVLAEPFDDWYFLMDADQLITGGWGYMDDLATSNCNVAEALFYQRGPRNDDFGTHPVRCIFRAVPGLEVRGRHFDYLLPDGTNLWGDYPMEPATATRVEVEHRHLRDPNRRANQTAFYDRRDELQPETKEPADGEIVTFPTGDVVIGAPTAIAIVPLPEEEN